MSMSKQCLLVIIPDRLSELIEKNEYNPLYYNPGELFDEVHILTTNDDRVEPAAMQHTVGRARLYLHQLPVGRGSIRRSLGFRPSLFKFWAEPAVELARQIEPALIRCHGDYFNIYAAACIKEKLGIPFVVSLHTNPDGDVGKDAMRWEDRLHFWLIRSMQNYALRQADLVMPVYQSIVPYLERRKVKKYQLVYNILNVGNLFKKDDYRLHSPVRIISVGRQIPGKNPDSILRAVARIPESHLTLVGNGLYHESLKQLAEDLGISSRVTFIKSIPNSELCAQLPHYDFSVIHSDYSEINKAALESLLTGLPLIVNQRVGQPVPELQEEFITLVDNTENSYYAAIRKMIDDDGLREQLGRQTYARARENWSPEKMEAIVVDIYKQLMLKA